MSSKSFVLFSEEAGYFAEFLPVWHSRAFYTSSSWQCAKHWRAPQLILADIEERINKWFSNRRFDTILEFLDNLQHLKIIQMTDDSETAIEEDLCKHAKFCALSNCIFTFYESASKEIILRQIYNGTKKYGDFLVSFQLHQPQIHSRHVLDIIKETINIDAHEDVSGNYMFITNNKEDINLLKICLDINTIEIQKLKALENACMGLLGFNPKELING